MLPAFNFWLGPSTGSAVRLCSGGTRGPTPSVFSGSQGRPPHPLGGAPGAAAGEKLRRSRNTGRSCRGKNGLSLEPPEDMKSCPACPEPAAGRRRSAARPAAVSAACVALAIGLVLPRSAALAPAAKAGQAMLGARAGSAAFASAMRPCRAAARPALSGISRSCPTALAPPMAARRACRLAAPVRLFAMAASGGGKQKLVFLGTPDVAAESLRDIIEASKLPDSEFEVAAVVSNPPSKAGRKKLLTPSPVQALAEEMGVDVLTPTGLLKKYDDSAEFLEKMRELAPDVCVTAAYGQFLPKSFLEIPRLGTVNIHPSLLPQFRGAAPVPRALEAGVDVTGVSVLFTVFEMDAGPVIAREEMALQGDEQAVTLLPVLFKKGTKLLLDVLPGVFSGKYKQGGEGCTIQDDAAATHAAKMSKEEGELFFTENAVYMHNKVRAFAGWPGTSTTLVLDPGAKDQQEIKVKIVKTRLTRPVGGAALGVHQVKMNAKGDGMVITCDDASQLEVLELQPPGKKVMQARDFWNGVRGKRVERKRVGWSTGPVPGGQ